MIYSSLSRGSSFRLPARERVPLAFPSPIRQVAPTEIGQTIRQILKKPRYIDRHLLDMARGQFCLLQSPLCNRNPETTVACHGSGLANGKGMGYKVSDALTCWGCSDCNHYTDAYGGATAAEKNAVFTAGHLRQIRAWEDIAADLGAPTKDRASAAAALAAGNTALIALSPHTEI